MTYSPHQLACFAHQLTRRAASNSMDRMAGALLDAQVDLNPHQIDAALFATSNPLSRGAILADEVGLGKTIEAGLLIAQKWAERKRRILVITPANLRKLLASSTFAIAGALETLSKRLGQALDELADELDAVADGSTKASTAAEIAAIWPCPSPRTPRAPHCCKPSRSPSRNSMLPDPIPLQQLARRPR